MIETQNGKNIYSDGNDTELQILQIAKQYPGELSQDYIENKNHFLLDYTFSAIRQNIINWYPFRENAELLEIGAGMGAITGVFCDKCKSVTAIEMSDRRADIIRERYKACKNLTVLSQNINDWKTEKKFDYIVFIGVLEYAELFSNAQDPFNEFLVKCADLLNENGTILFAIENRFGLKYWCGASEDHLYSPFIGIQGYPDKKSPKTFSKIALKAMLEKVGLENTRFYYPLPDYKFPQIIYSDEFLPEYEDLQDLLFTYHRSSLLTADEKTLYKDIMQNGVFDFFADSFLVEASRLNLSDNHIVYVSARDKVKKEHRVTTTIDSVGNVVKFPFVSFANPFLRSIYDNSEYLKKQGIDVVDTQFVNNTLRSKIFSGSRADMVFKNYLINNDFNKLCALIDLFKEYLLKSSPVSTTGENMLFEKEADNNCDYGIVLKSGFLDMNFKNCFYTNGKLMFFDQETVKPNIPLKYILYHSVCMAYIKANVKTEIKLKSLLDYIGITPPEIEVYDRFADYISDSILYRKDDASNTSGVFLLYNDKLTLRNATGRMQEVLSAFSNLRNENTRLIENEKKLQEKIKELNLIIEQKG
jgi:2-polyprenyl-3-methyl-5-hydroxy-6-metoxy-1,4-benzoquinol methylase